MMRRHTDRSYEAELAALREKVARMGARVEGAVATATRAIVQRDAAMAESVRVEDRLVNRLEVEIDEDCRRILALRQPAGSDLRFITTALKIVVDLERIGDLAANIAGRAIELAEAPPLLSPPDVGRLSELVQAQLSRAMRAFVDSDVALAEEVKGEDDLVDALYMKLFNQLLGLMMEDSRNIRRLTALMFVAKHLERAGDHATNVAEMAIYLARGTDVRHPRSRA
ncbi:MAG: phosphate signaling complex protein PhoU [Deltaproteobacteria bacterium]|nr:phosphate signaling complex protein PhoU [Deltaproteobacteria bacterium]